jgi:hypothetical protein
VTALLPIEDVQRISREYGPADLLTCPICNCLGMDRYLAPIYECEVWELVCDKCSHKISAKSEDIDVFNLCQSYLDIASRD